MKDRLIQKKICLLGDFAIGKTSLVRRFIYNMFDDRYFNTIGVNISRKEVPLSEEATMRLLIWDLSSNERFEKNRSDYLHGTSGALLVCDLSRPDTLKVLKSYYVDHLYKNNPQSFVVVIGNKIDLVPPDCEAIGLVMDLAAELKAPYQITSAKTGENVEAAFLSLAKGLYESSG
jgi:small GTP-binding protein